MVAAIALAVLAAAAAGLAGSRCRADEPADKGAELAQAAMEAQLAGDDVARQQALTEAAALDPQQPAIQWQQGRVKFDGQWRTPEDVAALVRQDPARRQYLRLRQQAAPSVEDQAALADWCERRELSDEERYHRMVVLWEQPDHRYSQKRLGLRPFRGRLHTDQQIADILAGEEQQQANLRRFSKQFESWLTDGLTGDAARRAEIVDRFRGVRDAGAIQAMQEAGDFDAMYLRSLGRRIGKSAASAFQRDVCLAIVDAVRSMPEHDATLFLAETSVFANDPELRAAAAVALRERRPTDYMPMLMNEMESLVDLDVDVRVGADGSVSYAALYRQEGAEIDQAHLAQSEHVTVTAPGPDGSLSVRFAPHVRRQWTRAANAAAQAQYEVQVGNIERQQINDRVTDALRMITGDDLGRDPGVWRQQWADFNDIYYPEERPVVTTEARDYSYAYIPPPRGQYGMSCFAAGTLVWTNRGKLAIETIVPGDMVLSQNPLTGELAYRPVLQTTVRPPTKFVELTLPAGEKIVATRGHRFWVVGDGWCMAKFLQPALRLHGAGAAVEVSQLEQFEGDQAHNLVIDDFHTYFVGDAKLLVHDNTCPVPTLSPIPGMDARRSSDSLARRFYGGKGEPKFEGWSE